MRLWPAVDLCDPATFKPKRPFPNHSHSFSCLPVALGVSWDFTYVPFCLRCWIWGHKQTIFLYKLQCRKLHWEAAPCEVGEFKTKGASNRKTSPEKCSAHCLAPWGSFSDVTRAEGHAGLRRREGDLSFVPGNFHHPKSSCLQAGEGMLHEKIRISVSGRKT